MATTFVRGFVLMLVLTGFGASSVQTRSTSKNPVAKANGMPVPLCLPSDPTHCGID